MNYSRTIKIYTRKVKRCHWLLRAAEADGEAASEGGGVRSALGMWRWRREEAGTEREMKDNRG